MDLLEEKMKLLSKPIWAVKDVMAYFELGYQYSKEMLDQSILRANGSVDGMPTRVYSESVIRLYTGHSREEEMKLLRAGIKKDEEI